MVASDMAQGCSALLLAGVASTVLLCTSASAQFNVQWVKFADAPAKLGVAPTALCDGNTEVDFATGDLNNDGWEDIYVGNDFHENDYYYVNNHN